mgnify:CR=1 FL=1
MLAEGGNAVDAAVTMAWVMNVMEPYNTSIAGAGYLVFRRADGGLTQTGGKELRPSDACLLGDDTIHQVTNPTREHAGAIHIYGGDFFTIERSEWDEDTLVEQPYDVERTLRNFEAANAGS